MTTPFSFQVGKCTSVDAYSRSKKMLPANCQTMRPSVQMTQSAFAPQAVAPPRTSDSRFVPDFARFRPPGAVPVACLDSLGGYCTLPCSTVGLENLE